MHSSTECSFKKTDKITRLDGIILQMKQDYAVVFFTKTTKKTSNFCFLQFSNQSNKAPFLRKITTERLKKLRKVLLIQQVAVTLHSQSKTKTIAHAKTVKDRGLQNA